MENAISFRDFKNNPSGLLGQFVLYESGTSYGGVSRYIKKIEKVTKTGFRITENPLDLFSFIDGYQKGLNGRMHIGTVSKCKLITPEYADFLRSEWKKAKETRGLREQMMEKLKTMTFEQLKQIESI
jgi:hypothetical protein